MSTPFTWKELEPVKRPVVGEAKRERRLVGVAEGDAVSDGDAVSRGREPAGNLDGVAGQNLPGEHLRLIAGVGDADVPAGRVEPEIHPERSLGGDRCQ
jgi:hypothetical protein